VNPFETETMAELCIRQGHLSDAQVILQRLVTEARDEATRQRLARRLAELRAGAEGVGGGPAGAGIAPPALAGELPVPGVRATVTGADIVLEWRLPQGTPTPAVALLLLTRGPEGIVRESRVVRVAEPAGRMALPAPALHSLRVAVGFQDGERFVPLARG
jgi:hypothetical protein